MPNGKNYTSFILTDRDQIKNFVGQISNEMFDYIESHNTSKFIVFYKNITHSDLATFGKATHPNSHKKNLLYYIKTEDMLEIEQNTKKPFQTAHQSCIGLKAELYNLVGLPQPRESVPYKINNYMNVYVVNKNMNYFSEKYTEKVIKKLGKEFPKNSKSWQKNNLDISLSSGNFTSIDLHVAVHGIGMEEDRDFHKIRHHLFKGDSLLLLFELNEQPKSNESIDKKTNNNMFLLFEKNPIFFNLIGETNSIYAKYQERIRQRLINSVTSKTNAIEENKLEDEVTRQQQNAWRNMLANEMMAYTQNSREVFCPFTYITIDFDKLGTLFVASHIKGFSDPNTTNEEKYDINNGILICANADALFDKHLITIDENKQLKFSFLLEGDSRLKQQLLLMQPIFTPILNEKRMQYLAYHRAIFEQKENERKKA